MSKYIVRIYMLLLGLAPAHIYADTISTLELRIMIGVALQTVLHQAFCSSALPSCFLFAPQQVRDGFADFTKKNSCFRDFGATTAHTLAFGHCAPVGNDT